MNAVDGACAGKGTTQAVPLYMKLRDSVAAALLDAADALPLADRDPVAQPAFVAVVPLGRLHVLGKLNEFCTVCGIVRCRLPAPLCGTQRFCVYGGSQAR